MGHCLAEFVVGSKDVNSTGLLHGGLIATIVDNFTTHALVTKDCKHGITVELHVKNVHELVLAI